MFEWIAKAGFVNIDGKLSEVINKTEGLDEIIVIEKLIAEFTVEAGYHIKKWSNELYGTLTSKLEGKAQIILKNISGQNGFEAWRRLKTEFDSATPAMCLRSVVSMVNPGKAADEKSVRAIWGSSFSRFVL